MRRFFIPPDQIENKEPRLGDRDARHIRTVLRLRPEDAIVVLDGEGAEYRARITVIDSHQVRVSLLEKLSTHSESSLQLVIAQGYLKDKKMDRLVRQLTELGVHRFIPFRAHRSVPVPDQKRMQARYERWHKISMEAAKQCHRSRPMAIEALASFEAAISSAQSCDLKLVFGETATDLLSMDRPTGNPPASAFVMIGPEGGFETAEIASAQHHGIQPVGLGPRILRAETAAVAACALVQYAFGDMGQNFLDNHRAV